MTKKAKYYEALNDFDSQRASIDFDDLRHALEDLRAALAAYDATDKRQQTVQIAIDALATAGGAVDDVYCEFEDDLAECEG